MSISVKIKLIVSMLFVGIVCGFLFFAMSKIDSANLVFHCILVGIAFGITNFLISHKIFKDYIQMRNSNEILKQDLKIDKLTGLYNRRAFDDDLKRNDNTDSYSVLFIDIDNFRQFNNLYGHQAGDEVLKKVGSTILGSVGLESKVYRFGGEEIIIIMLNTDKDLAIHTAEKIRENIYSLKNEPYPNISVSLGVSSYPEDGKDISDVIEACDMALLKAKKLGKNRYYSI